MVKSTDLVKVLDNGTVQECFEALDEFNKHNEKAREIGWLSLAEKLQVWRTIFQRLKDVNENKVILCQLLNALRILSREKAIMEDVMTVEYVRRLMIRAGLDSEDGPTSHDHLAGMKVIFNMTFQSETMQTMLLSCGLLGCLVKHSHPSQKKIPAENRYFLLKIYFIITALRKTCGAVVRKELNGIEVLLDFIDSIGEGAGTYDAMTADLICETLKVLYNVIHDIFPNKVELNADMFGSDFNLLCRLCVIIKRNLERAVNPPEKKLELSVHSIHPLCAMPVECYKELLNEDSKDVDDVRAIDAIVDCLDTKLDSSDYAPAEPILVALCKLCQNRIIRKYLKKRILPPLRKEDLMQPPESGTSIRNKLCSLIHNPSGHATEVAANLIFLLCKENVTKMVKYTGYGNAAGLLANRGLMLGGKGGGVYSDDSDGSDTEEYAELKNRVNDVEGWMKPEAPPIEMTEEQKEAEALKLVETISKLTCSKSTIQPCRIGPDGKPQPIEHVLELQEALDNSMKMSRGGGSDSDSD